MNTLTSLIHHPWTEILGWSLVHFLWQGVLVAAGLGLALWGLQRASANARYLAGLTALGLAALCPLGTAVWMAHSTASITPENETTLSAVNEPTQLPQVPQVPLTESASAERIEQSPRPESSPPLSMTSPKPLTPAEMETAEQTPELVITEANPVEANVSTGTQSPPVRDWFRRLLPGFVGLWFAGVMVFSIRIAVTWFRVQRLRHHGVFPVPTFLADRLAPLCEELGILRRVELLGSSYVDVPTVVGWLRPVVLFPMSALAGLSPSQMESLLVHELAHIRRWDVAVNWGQVVIETILFYHPAVWWISRRIRIERENCCDDVAASLTNDEVGYVWALLRMAELHVNRYRTVVTATDGDLSSRAKRLLSVHSPNRFAPGSGGIFLTTLILAVCAACWFHAAWAKDDLETTPVTETELATEEIDYENLTPERVLQEVEANMQRFSKVSYSATFQETRNANVYRNKEVLPISGKGRWDFQTDGTKWRVDKEGFTYRTGTTDVSPTHSISGFDGMQFYEKEGGKFVIGEEPNTNSQVEPQNVFWNGARTKSWLLSALRSWNAKIDRKVTIEGKKCLVITSKPGQPKPGETEETSFERTLWHYEITISPTQSWLPLKTILHMNGKLYGEETLKDVTQTPGGVWYPKTIHRKQHHQPDRLISKIVKVTRLELKDQFDPTDFQQALPIGDDIVNYSTGQTWYNDPWWPDMKPWLESKLNWPRPSLRVLGDMKSYVTEDIDGKPAPEIQAAKWLGKQPASWQAPGRKGTVVVFFGGRAIDPTPRWITALKVLQNRYGKEGLQIIGVATATAGDDFVKQTYQSLNPNFPWAIDSKNEGEGNHFGRTFQAFKLRHYAGVVFVGADGKLQSLESIQTPPNSKISRLEYIIRMALEKDVTNYQPDSGWLSDKEIRQIDTEWKRRQNAKTGKSQIRLAVQVNAEGRETFGEVPVKETQPETTIRLRAIPMMQMLYSDTTGGWHLFMDYDHAIEEEFKAKDGLVLKNLRRGSYRLILHPENLAARELTVRLVNDEDTQNVNLEFHQGNTITGEVQGTDGQPIAGAKIRCLHRHPNPNAPKQQTNSHLPRNVSADAQGEFTFPNLFEGAFHLEIAAKGYQTRTLTQIPAGKQNLKIVLRKPGEAAGVTKTDAPPRVFLCDIKDQDTGQPIPNVALSWQINHKETHKPIWQENFVTDAQGQYEVRMPQSVFENAGYIVYLEVNHRDYLPKTGVGYSFRDRKASEFKLYGLLHHMKLKRGKEVTGQFIDPNGTPIQNLTVMVGDNRDGFQDGIGIGYYTKTDAQGRFRLVTKSRWPQRISWFPKDYAANSKAITKSFGDQGTIRLRPGRKLTGKIVTHDGKPMPGVYLRATNGTRIPRRYAKSNAKGEFTFDPLPDGRYALRVVRNRQDHHNQGKWSQVDLPVPIPVKIHQLKNESKPLVIRGPNTVRIHVKVIDEKGKPLSEERIAIGQTGDYRNAILSKPVPGKPGEYEFLFPEGEYIRDMIIRHPWEQAAFYQESPDKPFVPGNMLVLGKAEEDISGITIQLRKAGHVQLRIKTDQGQPMPKRTNMQTRYVNTYPDSSVRAHTGAIHTRNPNGPWSREITQVVPDEPLTIQIDAPGFQRYTKTIEVTDGETKTLDVILSPKDD